MIRKTVDIGIMPIEEYKKRTIAIARGEYIPSIDEPKIWFNSLESVAKVLNNENKKLLNAILENNPQSLQELAHLTGREKSNLSRTLKTMERYGIVKINKNGRSIVPEVMATNFHLEISLGGGKGSGLNF